MNRPHGPLPGSLARRLFLSTLLAILSVAILLTLDAAQHRNKLQRQSAEHEARLLAAALADALDGDLLRRDYAAIEEVAHHLIQHPAIVELAVTDRNGRLLVAVREVSSGGQPQVRLSGRLELPSEKTRLGWLDERRLAAWQAVGVQAHSGWLYLELASDTAGDVPVSPTGALFGALLAVALAIILHLLLVKPALAHLSRLTAFARQLPRESGARLTLADGVRETAELTQALDELSVELARRDARLERNHLRLSMHQRIFELLATGGALHDLLTLIVEEVEQERPDLLASILLFDAGSQTLRLGAAPSLPGFFNEADDGIEVGDGVGCCGTAAFRAQPVYVADIRTHPYWQAGRELAERAGLIACWCEPIFSVRGETLGVLAFYRREAAEPVEADRALLCDLACLASVVIERKRLDDELLLASSVYRSSGEAMFVTDAENRIVTINPAFSRLTGYSADEVIGRDLAMLGSPRNAPSLYRNMGQALEQTGHWQGEIWNRRRNGEEFAKWLSISSIHDESGRLIQRIGLFSDLTEIKKTEEAIWQQSNYDALTGLPNRRLFRDRLRQELRRTNRLAVLMIDLDHFKSVNDAFGQAAGDQVLVEAARRIVAQTGERDTVARLSGDGFAVAMPQPPDPTAVEQVASAIVSALGQSFPLGDESAFVVACIGITLFPDDAEDLDALLRNAEQAMSVAKRGYRGGFAWFTDEMQLAAQVRRDLVRDLRGALKARQFEVYYQPIVDLASGRTVKAEALLRWQHPQLGPQSPAQFIQVLEESGLIVEVGGWVLAEACHFCAQLLADGLVDSERFSLCVNISPRQFRQHDFVERVASSLRDSQLPNAMLKLEITEGIVIQNIDDTVGKMLRLKKHGVSFAMDDFGTGYSSLTYLKRLPVDMLKIDQSFVRDATHDPNDAEIIRAIVAMARSLGLALIAEGVEQQDQLDFLQSQDCHLYQGYLFSKPLPQEAFRQLLERQRA